MNLNDLSPELQEKAKNCKSLEELVELCNAESIKLSDEAIEGLAGSHCRELQYPSICIPNRH